MSNRSGVSVLVTVSEHDESFEETLLSLVKQTFHKWEIIIGIYRCGISSTLEKEVKTLVDKYQKNGLNIRVIVYGMDLKYEVLNSMVCDATYDYISVVDVGDVWESDKLEHQFPLLEKYDVVGTKCQHYGDTVGFPNIPNGELSHVNFLMRNPVCNSSVILHKRDAFWEECEEINQYPMWIRLHSLNRNFYNINKVLCKERKKT